MSQCGKSEASPAHCDHRSRPGRPVHGDPPEAGRLRRLLASSRRANGVGGTWYHNRYPGCACDIPSHLYSFSFEIKRDWSRPYAPQPEILDYMEHLAEKYDLLPHCRFGSAGQERGLGRGEARAGP